MDLTQKSELEKRWEVEVVEEEKAIRNAARAVDELNEKFEENTLDRLGTSFINHPLVEGSCTMPMALIVAGSTTYLGGLQELSDGGCVMCYPLEFMEHVVRSPEGKPMPQVGMKKPVIVLEIPEQMWFRHTSLYVLSSNMENNINLVSAYERFLKGALAEAAGIIAPSENDVGNVVQGRFTNV